MGACGVRGYRFVALRAVLGLSAAEAEPAATGWQHARGQAFLGAVRLAFWMTGVLSWLIGAVGVLVLARVALVLPTACGQLRRSRRRRTLVAPHPTVTVVVPAYNDAVGIERAVRSLAASTYRDLDVVVVDDGSTDGTAGIVEGLGLDRVRLIRRRNGGKAAALDTGIRESTAEVIVMVDGDTVFEPETVRAPRAPLRRPRSRGGRRQHQGRQPAGPAGPLAAHRVRDRLQPRPAHVRGVREHAHRAGRDRRVPRRAEDADLRSRSDRALSSTLSGLWRQRYRWSFGTMQAVWKHKGAVVSRDPRERRIGRRALPYMICFQVLLPIIAPLIDLYAIYGIIFTDPGPVIVAWVAFNLAQLVLAVVAFRLDGESLRPLWALPLQQFVYRQLMYLVIIESTISALVGARASWRHIPRTGDVEVPPSPAAAQTT